MAIETFEDNFFELHEEPEWIDKVHGWAMGSWVQGGNSGVDNLPLKELTKRTGFLKKEVDTIAGFIGSIFGGVHDVSGVVNRPWYNPGTGLGGIAWVDPTGEFDHLEIIDTYEGGAEVIAEVAPGWSSGNRKREPINT